jgi:hypothetical protein
MGTWIKENRCGHLFDAGRPLDFSHHQISSQNNPKEKVANISGLRSWFTRDDYPRV